VQHEHAESEPPEEHHEQGGSRARVPPLRQASRRRLRRSRVCHDAMDNRHHAEDAAGTASRARWAPEELPDGRADGFRRCVRRRAVITGYNRL